MPSSTKGVTHLGRQQKQDSPQIPTQPRPTTTTTTKNTATPPSTKSGIVGFHIYQLPSNLRGWADDDRDLKAPLRHLGLLDVARLKVPTGVPRPSLVSQLVSSYDPKKRSGYVDGTRVNVDRESFLRAVSLQPTAERRDLPPNVPRSTVTRAAERFISMCLGVQRRDTLLPILSAAMQVVEAGSAHTVDWGKLMWDLVENEILELPKRGDKISYFGVYLQRLIWVQQPHLFKCYEMAEAASVKSGIRVGMKAKPMEAQSSQLGIMLNDDAGLDKSDSESFSSTLNDGKVLTDGHNDHMEAHQRFQQGKRQKMARNDNGCGVATRSAIVIADSSHDIVEIERELKHATSEELREAETFTQVVKLLQEKLSPETIMHMFE
uniref:Uncharacterized protein n=2 Tax=Avena sativa TaxID=4498 RepID=A0ACD6AE71_AVESA